MKKENQNEKVILIDEINKYKKEINILNKKLKSETKKVVGLLWLWFFLPIIGWLIYINLYTRRINDERYNKYILEIKYEIAKLEYKILLNESKIESMK